MFLMAFTFILINVLINIDKQLYFLILNKLKSNGKKYSKYCCKIFQCFEFPTNTKFL